MIHDDLNWKQSKYLLIGEWITKLWNVHTMKYYSVANKKKLLIHTIWMNLKYIR